MLHWEYNDLYNLWDVTIVCMYIYIYLYLYVYMYTYIEPHMKNI